MCLLLHLSHQRSRLEGQFFPHCALKMSNFQKVVVLAVLLNALSVIVASTVELRYVGHQVCKTRPRSTSEDKVDSKPYEGSMYLQIYAAGAGGKAGPVLRKTDKFCPKTFTNGFSVFCKGAATSTKQVTFSVNGKDVRVERYLPYAIVGDYKGNARPWKDYPREATIKCSTDSYDSVEVTVRFEC